jgi:hypothetical protein
MEAQKENLLLGGKVIGGLAALTLLEFWIASAAEGPIPYPPLCGLLAPISWFAVWAQANPIPYLGIIAILKAVLIGYYFMHIAQIWKTEGGHG